MTHVSRSALVPYSTSEMFALVADIHAYPDFLPGVSSVKIHSQSEDEVKASIELAKGPMRKSFTTLNRLEIDKNMRLSLVEGPFHHLNGNWSFHPLGEHGSKISMHLDFEFSSRLLAATLGPVFNEMVNRLVDSFIERARSIYGRR